MVEYLPSKREALSSKSSTTKKTKQKTPEWNSKLNNPIKMGKIFK
jgi:hypothetical protein